MTGSTKLSILVTGPELHRLPLEMQTLHQVQSPSTSQILLRLANDCSKSLKVCQRWYWKITGRIFSEVHVAQATLGI